MSFFYFYNFVFVPLVADEEQGTAFFAKIKKAASNKTVNFVFVPLVAETKRAKKVGATPEKIEKFFVSADRRKSFQDIRELPDYIVLCFTLYINIIIVLYIDIFIACYYDNNIYLYYYIFIYCYFYIIIL